MPYHQPFNFTCPVFPLLTHVEQLYSSCDVRSCTVMKQVVTFLFCNTSVKTQCMDDFSIPDSIAISSHITHVVFQNGRNSGCRCVVCRSYRHTKALLVFSTVLTLLNPLGRTWNCATIWRWVATHFPQEFIHIWGLIQNFPDWHCKNHKTHHKAYRPPSPSK